MKEFYFGDFNKRARLLKGHIESKIYKKYHEELVICCHDVVIDYNSKILLVERNIEPAKGLLWPIGGKLIRGLDNEESLKRKVKDETGLEISEIKFLGIARTLFDTDPFNHGKGTDTVNLLYYAKGDGEIKLDRFHSGFRLLTLDEYNSIRNNINEFTSYIMDLALPFFK